MRAEAALGVVAALCLSCAPTSERSVVHRHFVDLSEVDQDGLGRLDGAVIGPRSSYEVRDVAIHGDRRPAVSFEAPARISFHSDAVVDPVFRFGLAVRPPGARLRLRVEAGDDIVHEEEWTEERAWVERRVPLAKLSERGFRLDVSFEGEEATVILAHPRIQGAAPRSSPNVIVYLVDCLRADHVGAYGYGLPTTPSIDALARDGVVLEDLTACAPWTKPSTACLFTSLLPTFHQARTMDDVLSRELTTLAEVFRAQGYVTAAWVANPVIDPRVFLFNQGFDRWMDMRSFEERAQSSNIHDIDPDAADITTAVLPWLAEHREEQFFLYLHSLDLHYGYRPRPPFDERFVSAESTGLERDRELYDNELAYNDAEIGKLVAGLKELGLYQDTIVLVTADHGEEFGEHGETRHGKTLYQQALHIPGILKLPGSRLAGRRSGTLASNVDLAPTLLELSGIEPPAELRGRSLVAAMNGTDAEAEDRRVFAEVVAPNFVGYAIRDSRFKHVKTLVPELDELLFDLANDPGETRNLLPDPPAEARRLVAELERFAQLGQQGVHVAVRGAGESSRTRVTLQTEAEIASAIRYGIATGDVLELSSDRNELTLDFVGNDLLRHLVVQTRPPRAPLKLEARSDGAPFASSRIRLGKTGKHPGAVPVVLDAVELEVSVVDAERLLHEAEGPLWVWYVSGGERVDLDEETLGVLKALGYIQ